MKFFRKKQSSETQSLLHRSRNSNNLRAQTFSHHAARDRDSSRAASRGEKKPKDSKNRFERVFFGLLTALSVGCIGYVLWLETTPRIKVITPSQNTASSAVLLREESVYLDGISAILKQSVVNRSKLFMNSNAVSAEILKQFPEFGDVVVSIPLISHRPIVSITPRSPVIKLQTTKGIYLIDSTGTVLANIADISLDDNELNDLVDLPLIEDQTATEVSVGNRVVTEETTQFMLDISDQLALTSLEVKSVYLPRVTPNELRIQFSGKPYFAKLDTTSDSRRQIGSLLSAISYVSERGSAVNEYIDVRVDGKVFYK